MSAGLDGGGGGAFDFDESDGDPNVGPTFIDGVPDDCESEGGGAIEPNDNPLVAFASALAIVGLTPDGRLPLGGVAFGGRFAGRFAGKLAGELESPADMFALAAAEPDGEVEPNAAALPAADEDADAVESGGGPP